MRTPMFKNYIGAAMVAICLFTVFASAQMLQGRNASRSANPSVTHSTLTDMRDGKICRTVTMPDGKTWMAENLNYDTLNGIGSSCYNNSPDSCAKYGRLYDWSTAMAGASNSSTSPSGVRGVCPVNWHLPSDAEWAALMTAVGGEATASRRLKSKTGWNENGNGVDEYGFSALPGGAGSSGLFGKPDSFRNVGISGSWWTATEHFMIVANSVDMNYSDEVGIGVCNKGIRLSVRCVLGD